MEFNSGFKGLMQDELPDSVNGWEFLDQLRDFHSLDIRVKLSSVQQEWRRGRRLWKNLSVFDTELTVWWKNNWRLDASRRCQYLFMLFFRFCQVGIRSGRRRVNLDKGARSITLLQSACNFCFWRDSPQWARASSFTRFLDHTQRRTTVGRTPLDEWSARRRDLYLTTHNTHNRQTSMPPVGFEPTISAGERP